MMLQGQPLVSSGANGSAIGHIASMSDQETYTPYLTRCETNALTINQPDTI